jgi:hypothetical protein
MSLDVTQLHYLKYFIIQATFSLLKKFPIFVLKHSIQNLIVAYKHKWLLHIEYHFVLNFL